MTKTTQDGKPWDGEACSKPAIAPGWPLRGAAESLDIEVVLAKFAPSRSFLEAKPHLWATAECFRYPDRHFRGKSSFAIDKIIQSLLSDTERPR